jgi:hypothetical protein
MMKAVHHEPYGRYSENQLGELASPYLHDGGLQVADINRLHADLLSMGVREGMQPTTLGDVARISMILDPDGNLDRAVSACLDRGETVLTKCQRPDGRERKITWPS